MNTETERFSLDVLCELTGLSKRTVRYYIQQGLLDRPLGSKRGSWYERAHVEQLLEIRKWQGAGLSLDRIRELLGNAGESHPTPPPRPTAGQIEVWSHIALGAGIELHLEPGQAKLSPEQITHLIAEVLAALTRIRDHQENTP